MATGGRARTSARSTQYAPFLKDRKIAFIRLEGEGFGGTPLALEVRMSVEDSPSTAGNVLDAVRYLKCTMERGIAGIVDQEVIAQYSYTYDAQDAEGFAALFTEDAVWELFAWGATRPEIRLASRAAIRAWAAQRLQERRGRYTSRHYQSGLLFDALTADAARTRTMVLVTHQGITEAAPRLTASGVYHDQWRKTQEGWQFAYRILRRDSSAPLVST